MTNKTTPSYGNFVQLHNHTTFSILDGISRREDLIKKAKSLCMPGVAITDHGNIYNCISFYKSCYDAGITPIIGQEFYVSPDSRFGRDYAKKADAAKKAEESGDLSSSAYHLTVLAKNREGYDNLMSLSTIGWREGFYRKPRIDMDILTQHKNGLVVLSGCFASMVSQLIVAGQKDKAIELVDRQRSIFGDDFFIELMHHDMGEEEALLNETLIDISRELGIPTVMTNDSHFTNEEDAIAHEVALCIGTNKLMTDPDHFKFNGSGYWFKTSDEMYKTAKIAQIPEEALSNTLLINNMISDYGFKLTSKKHPPQVPLYRNSDGDALSADTCHNLLEVKVWDGLIERGLGDSQQHQERVVLELELIKRKNFSSYFLIIADIVDFMRRNNMPVPIGRGSSMGSLVCYCMFITGMDPVRFGIPFSRFINEGRKDLPDIDTDISQHRRKEVIDYIVNRYGKDNVAQIVTFQSMGAKSALDNVGRALGVPAPTRRQVNTLIGETSKDDRVDDLLQSNKKALGLIEQVPDWMRISAALEGNNRNLGAHAAGIVICNDPINAQVPLGKDSKEGYKVTQFDMKDLQELGILKLDMLGLKTLDLVHDTISLIKQRHGISIDFHHLPLEDKPTYDLIATGKYVSVFQYDSSGIRATARQLRPENFDHLVALNALYRPGPMERVGNEPSILEQYIDRRHGKAPIEVWHPDLKGVFDNSLGLCIEENQNVKLYDGSCKKIKDVLVGDVVLSINSTANRVTHVINKGKKHCIKLTTETGRELTLTTDHVLLINGSEQQAKNVIPGDFVHMPYVHLDTSHNTTLTEDQAYCIGVLLGDGSTNHSTPLITLGNDRVWGSQVYTNFKTAWPQLIPREYNKCRSYYLSLKQHEHGPTRNDVSSCLRRLGLRKITCKDKSIPKELLCSRDSIKLHILAGLWDSDGSVSSAVHFTSESVQLINDVHRILSHYHISHYINKRGNRVYVRDVKKFMLLVPLRHHAKLISAKRNSGHMRLHKSHLVKHFKSSNLKSREYAATMGIARAALYNGRGTIAATTANKIDPGLFDLYYNTHDSERVISIEDAGVCNVYDLSMEDSSRPWFTSNDILVHNCIFQESLMKMSQIIAGFNETEADEYRAAVGKKCLPLDAEILSCDADRFTVKELLDNPHLLSELDFWIHDGRIDCKPVRGKLTNIRPSGRQKLLKIRTSTGRVLRVTHTHKIATFSGDKEAGHLAVGDCILRQSIDHGTLTHDCNDEYLINSSLLLGLLAGDGKCSGSTPGFIQNDGPIADLFCKLVNSIPYTTYVKDTESNPSGVPTYRIVNYHPSNHNPIKYLLEFNGVNQNAESKRAPYAIRKSHYRDEVCAYIAGQFMSDGFVCRCNTDASKVAYFGFASHSFRLINDTQVLLGKLGIHSTIRHRRYTTHVGGKEYSGTTYECAVRSIDGMNAFYNMMSPYVVNPKLGRMKDVVYGNYNKTCSTHIVWPPAIKDIIRTQPGFQSFSALGLRKRDSSVSIDTLGGLSNLGKRISDINNSNLLPEYVVDISEGGCEDTYDISTNSDTYEHFICDDIVVHNSKEKFNAAQAKLRERGIAMGRDPVFMDDLLNKVAGFARYGWNIGHSLAYSYISFATAFLEAHFPFEYYTTLLNVNLDDNDQLKILLSSILQRGVEIRPPNVNDSMDAFTTNGKYISMGLQSVRQVGSLATAPIIEERKKNGPHKDFIDFCIRMGKHGRYVTKLVKENLIKAGAFNWDTTYTYKAKLDNVELVQDIVRKFTEKDLPYDTTRQQILDKVIFDSSEYSIDQQLSHERSVLNFYITSHPVVRYLPLFNLFPSLHIITPSQVQVQDVGTHGILFGIVESKEMKTTKRGDPYVRLKLGDHMGSVDVMIWSPLASTIYGKICEQSLVLISGIIKYDKIRVGDVQFSVNSITPLTPQGLPIKGFIAASIQDANQVITTLNISGATISNPIMNMGCAVIMGNTAYISPEDYASLKHCRINYQLDIG